MSTLLGSDYSSNQMGYDLARLRRKGLIRRLPKTNTYLVTPDGQRIAIFYTRVHDRLLRPLTAADKPPAPIELRNALAAIDRHVGDCIAQARLGKAARNSRLVSEFGQPRNARCAMTVLRISGGSLILG